MKPLSHCVSGSLFHITRLQNEGPQKACQGYLNPITQGYYMHWSLPCSASTYIDSITYLKQHNIETCLRPYIER